MLCTVCAVVFSLCGIGPRSFQVTSALHWFRTVAVCGMWSNPNLLKKLVSECHMASYHRQCACFLVSFMLLFNFQLSLKFQYHYIDCIPVKTTFLLLRLTCFSHVFHHLFGTLTSSPPMLRRPGATLSRVFTSRVPSILIKAPARAFTSSSQSFERVRPSDSIPDVVEKMLANGQRRAYLAPNDLTG